MLSSSCGLLWNIMEQIQFSGPLILLATACANGYLHDAVCDKLRSPICWRMLNDCCRSCPCCFQPALSTSPPPDSHFVHLGRAIQVGYGELQGTLALTNSGHACSSTTWGSSLSQYGSLHLLCWPCNGDSGSYMHGRWK